MSRRTALTMMMVCGRRPTARAVQHHAWYGSCAHALEMSVEEIRRSVAESVAPAVTASMGLTGDGGVQAARGRASAQQRWSYLISAVNALELQVWCGDRRRQCPAAGIARSRPAGPRAWPYFSRLDFGSRA